MASTQNAIDNTFATTGLTGTIATSQIANSAVTYAKIQNESAVTLLGNPTGSGAAPSEITLGTNLSFSGTTLVASSSYAPLPIVVVTGTTQAAAINTSYVANNAGLVTVTLPSTAVIGSVINIGGLGAGGWALAQNAAQLIHFGSAVTTTGTGGSIASQNAFDNITIQCVVANTTWLVIASQGNMTVT